MPTSTTVVSVVCPACGRTGLAPEACLGRPVQCDSCGARFTAADSRLITTLEMPVLKLNDAPAAAATPTELR
jgi:hypothetical protein